MTGENTSIEPSSSLAPESSPSELKPKWSGLGYSQVRGLADRVVSRYLRTQRKNMRRFFASRGMLDLLERLEQIKRSRQGMMAKNQMFQELMNEYVKTLSGNQPAAGTEAAATKAEGSGAVVLQPDAGDGSAPAGASGLGSDPDTSVPRLEVADAESADVVINE